MKMTLKLAWLFQKNDYSGVSEMKADVSTFIVSFIST